MRTLLIAAIAVTVLAACGQTSSSAPAKPAETAAAKPAETAPAADAAKPAADAAAAKAAEDKAKADAAAKAAADAAAAAKPATPAQPAAPAQADAAKAATDAAAAVAKPVVEEKALPDVVHATIHVPAGDIHVNLFHKTAPLSVENFVKLTKSKFYDGLAFHRVEPGFVAQGGDPNTREGATGIPGTGGPGYTIPAENGPSNPEKHLAGTLGMADSGLNTAGSQFYFTLAATPHLDGRYTVFGRVASDKDLEVVRQIKKGDRFSVTIDDK